MTARTGRIGIIGGGLGGLAAACTLAARGYEVTLLEKSPWLGGKAAVLEEAGFRFDMGPTILTIPSVLRRIFAEAGRKLEDHLDLLPLDPQWRCFFPAGGSSSGVLDLVANVEQMCRKLDAFAPGGVVSQGYRRFIDFSKRLHSISERFFFWRSIGSIWDMMDLKNMFKPAMLADVLSMKLGKSVAECVRSHVPDHRVAQMLDHFTQYVGSAPDASPAVLCGIAHMQTQEGVWYPRGGIRAVPAALAELARILGVELRTGVGVRRILLDDDGAAAGVETDSNEKLSFAAVVSNSDAVRTHRDLLAGTRAAQRFEGRRAYEPACSGVVLYLGLNKAYDHLLHHNFVFSRDPEVEFEEIYHRGVPAADPTCYVCAPARTEPDVAPPGGEALYVLVHTPYLRPGQDWKQMFPAYRQAILRKLADTAGLGDLEQRIRFESRITPQDIHDRYRVLNGAIYGLASHGRYVGAFKPANRSRHVKGLYLAGGAAHPGPGMPMVLMSGWIAADTLDQDNVAAKGTNRLPSLLGGEGLGVRGARSEIPRETVVAGSQTPHPRPMAAPKGRGEKDGSARIPQRSPWLIRLFTRYCHGYLRRNFHTVRLARNSRPIDPGPEPLLIVLNHPSWWDPLVCLVLSELFPNRKHFAPIDASALARYRFFEKLGFYGVEQGTRQGGLAFLHTSLALLASPDNTLWITAQGRFTDPRQRPATLQQGVGHLARRLHSGVILPLALEYPFWEERYPEVLARFGVPIAIGNGKRRSVEEWMQVIEGGLTEAQDGLARLAMARDVEAFDTLIGGSAGVGGIYDLWRRIKAFFSGKCFVSEHGKQEAPTALGGAL
jgi:diapolycopene oxygenase